MTTKSCLVALFILLMDAYQKPSDASCCSTVEIAILAGGCFWGMEEILRKIPGVIGTEVGYTGGTTAKPTYEQVKTGTTGHAEAVRLTVDSSKLSYADLLSKWFFRMHDPTTLNQQGNDRGTQYRSAIFYTSETQRKTAEQVKSGIKGAATQIVKAGPFTKAEEYHQDYLQKNPGGYTCHFLR
jgi:peptide methionine sulfoxide reductase msrA/msrB